MIERRRSGVHGWGVFATRPITKNTRIVDYAGEKGGTLDGVIWIRAARRIEPGEELTYDFHTDGAAGVPCRCRPGCARVL